MAHAPLAVYAAIIKVLSKGIEDQWVGVVKDPSSGLGDVVARISMHRRPP